MDWLQKSTDYSSSVNSYIMFLDQHHDQFLPRTFPEFENSDVIDISFSQYHPEVIIVTKGGKISFSTKFAKIAKVLLNR